MSGALIKTRFNTHKNVKRGFYWQKPKVSHAIIDILKRASYFFPIGRNLAVNFSEKYAYENSGSGRITHQSAVNSFGYGYLINGKWSFCGWELDYELSLAKEYCVLSTREHKTPWLDSIVNQNKIAYLNAKKGTYKNITYCPACGKSTKGENRYYCKSCEMKLYHLRKKEHELAVAKQLTKKLKEEIKNEIQRIEKTAN